MTQQIPNYDEEIVGANHPTKADTVNRGFLINHDSEGNHKYCVFPEESSDPTTAANQGAVYTKESGGVTELFFRRESDGDVIILSPTGALGYRNRIINGNFDIWQRGTSFTASGYTADKWRLAINGSSCTTTQQAFTVGQTDVPGEPEFYHRNVVTSSAGAGNYAYIKQSIEDVRTFAGQKAVYFFYAKADAAKNIAVELVQSFGSGGSPSADVTAIDVNTIALTTAWQLIAVVVDVPSISGKTIGTTANTSHLDLIFWFDAGSDFNSRTNTLGQQSGTFEVAQVQMEHGSVNSPFENRGRGIELELCKRFYQKSYSDGVYAGTATLNGSVYTAIENLTSSAHSFNRPVILPIEMRIIPTIVLYDAAGASGKVTMAGGDGRTGTVYFQGTKSFMAQGTEGNANVNRNIVFHYTADSDF